MQRLKDSRNPYIHLSQDPVMKKLIDKHGILDMDWVSGDVFTNIVGEIISQQLSIKAADTILSRFKNLLKNTDPFLPSEVIALDDDIIRHKAGISYAKIGYIKGISEAVLKGKLNFNDLINQSDEEVFNTLTSLKGIGPWTAEMLLMHTFKRPDIFSVGDAGLRRAVSALYNIDQTDHTAILTVSKTWSPYRTYASRYLWKSLE